MISTRQNSKFDRNRIERLENLRDETSPRKRIYRYFVGSRMGRRRRGIQFIEKKKEKKEGKTNCVNPFHLKIVALRNKRKNTIHAIDFYEQFSTSNIRDLFNRL